MSFNALYTDEAKEEIRKFLTEPRAYLNTNGELRMSASFPTIDLVLYNLTSRK
ncbi:MAG: hypothetical protein M0P09_00590 [Acholeplasmataceae bacterium]|nr:hypothetical protein [Acholeplasmataceae bacterium]